MPTQTAIQYVPRTIWRGETMPPGERAVAEETAIAFTYNGTSHAVMMGTPLDLEDFAFGFSLTEGMVDAISEIESVEAIKFDKGIELRLWILEERMDNLRHRRRRMAGPTGCGLCGVESLAEAMRPVTCRTSAAVFGSDDIMTALHSLEAGQPLHRETRAVHAAGLWQPGPGAIAIREDVGRHNALDKLIGAASRMGAASENSIIVLSSRISVEMVQKAAVFGSPVIVAVSAPTALAIRTAERAGITLAGVARHDGFEVFTRPERIRLGAEVPVV